MNTGWQGAGAPGDGQTGYGQMGGRPGMMGQPGDVRKPGDIRMLAGELLEMLRDGVTSGDADAGVPDEIDKLIQSGAGMDAVVKALRQATERGRMSPLLLVKAEKVLGVGPTSDELTDRGQLLGGNNRNKLTF